MTDLFQQRRLKRSANKDKVFDMLSRTKNSRYGFFTQMTDIYMFALSLGLKNRKRSPLSGPASEPIQVSVFREDQVKYFDMIALYDTAGKLDSLDKSSEERVNEMQKTIEEYANGGLEIMLNEIEVHPENSFNIIKLIIAKELKENIPEDALEEISW